MCDRSSDPTEHDAARERPSALDVERLGEVYETVARETGWDLEVMPPPASFWRLFAAEYARLTEPDAGEGTDPMLGTPADGRHPDHGPCGQTPCPHIPTPDTTEARVEYQRGYSDGFRQLFEDMTAARLATPDTTEATLDHIAWAQAIRLKHEATHGEAEQCGAECIVLGLTEFDEPYRESLEEIDPTQLTPYQRGYVDGFDAPENVKARAALQQPAVQPEGGPE